MWKTSSISLIGVFVATLILSSCDAVSHVGIHELTGNNNVTAASFTCDDLKQLNNILLVTAEYDEKYDVNTDDKITVEDKLIVEEMVAENNVSCGISITQSNTCDELLNIIAELDNWTTSKAVSYVDVKNAIAYSIMYFETGVNCAPSPSFVGDVNMNGYLDCDDYQEIKRYVGSPSIEPIVAFNATLADPNVSGTINAVDVSLIMTAVNYLLENYAAYLDQCPVY